MTDELKKSKLKGKGGVYNYECLFCCFKANSTAPEYLLKNYFFNIILYTVNIARHLG